MNDQIIAAIQSKLSVRDFQNIERCLTKIIAGLNHHQLQNITIEQLHTAIVKITE
jgi:hypothetical protein